MTTTRRASVCVGILYILGTMFGILSGALSSSSLSDTSYLEKIYQNQNTIRFAALSIICMGIALSFVAIILYPYLERTNKKLALIYVVFRGGLETITYIITSISFLLLINLSKILSLGNGNSIELYNIGELLKSISGLQITAFIFCINAFILYILFYQNKMIPRWISIWGIIAIILHFITGLLVTFDLQNSESSINTIINLPIFLQEMVMAIWIIAKGLSIKE
jgi:hypothetical protein